MSDPNHIPNTTNVAKAGKERDSMPDLLVRAPAVSRIAPLNGWGQWDFLELAGEKNGRDLRKQVLAKINDSRKNHD